MDVLPVVTTLHDGAKPLVTLVRQARATETREVFRAWRSGFDGVIDGAKFPIFVGSVVRERVAHPGKTLSLPVVDKAAEPATIELPGALTRRAGGPGRDALQATMRRLDDVSAKRPAR